MEWDRSLECFKLSTYKLWSQNWTEIRLSSEIDPPVWHPPDIEEWKPRGHHQWRLQNQWQHRRFPAKTLVDPAKTFRWVEYLWKRGKKFQKSSYLLLHYLVHCSLHFRRAHQGLYWKLASVFCRLVCQQMIEGGHSKGNLLQGKRLNVGSRCVVMNFKTACCGQALIWRWSFWCHHHHHSAAKQATISFFQSLQSWAKDDIWSGWNMHSLSPSKQKMYFTDLVSFSHVEVHKGHTVWQVHHLAYEECDQEIQFPASDTFYKRLGVGHGIDSGVGDMICPFDVQHYAITGGSKSINKFDWVSAIMCSCSYEFVVIYWSCSLFIRSSIKMVTSFMTTFWMQMKLLPFVDNATI